MTGVEPIELETPFGRLRGEQSGGVAAFRRVPYAEAPIGQRRFELPGRAPRWQGVRDAVTPGPIPPQLPSRLEAVMGSYHAERGLPASRYLDEPTEGRPRARPRFRPRRCLHDRRWVSPLL